MTKAPQKHPMDEAADKAKPAKTPNSKGYWVVRYLKQPEHMGVWDVSDMIFPTEEEAHAYADTLREGRHAAISVTHKDWE